MLELIGVVLDDPAVGRLDRLSLAVQEGEVLGLVGGTGAGKTAALAVAAGAATPQRGRITLGGRDVTRSPGKLRAQTAWCGERLPGPDDLTVQRWLAWWGRADGLPAAQLGERGAAALERFAPGGADQRVAELSRGGRRLLGLTRIWQRRPSIYLLDAPGDGLDGGGLRRLTQAIKSVVADGSTVILTASAPHLPAAICDRVVCMVSGGAIGEAQRSDPAFEARIAAAQGWSS